MIDAGAGGETGMAAGSEEEATDRCRRGDAPRALGMALALVLAGCAGPTGGSGDGSPAAARLAACERMCNHDYESCADSLGANRDGGAVFGTGIGAACDRENRSCLDRCRAITAEPEPADQGGNAGRERGAP